MNTDLEPAECFSLRKSTWPGPRGQVLCWILACWCLAFLACRPASDEAEPLETVDIEPGIEVEIANDLQAAPEVPKLSGILPEDFPKDVPLYLPASLVDYGRTDDGRYIDLLASDNLATVRRELTHRMQARGWRISGDFGRPSGVVIRQGDRKIRLTIQDGRPGTLCRYIY